MTRFVIRVLALLAALLVGAVIGALAEAVIAGHDDRPYLAPTQRRALDEDWWTG